MVKRVKVQWNYDGKISFEIPNRFIDPLDRGDWKKRKGKKGTKYALVKANHDGGEEYILIPRLVVQLLERGLGTKDLDSEIMRLTIPLDIWASLGATTNDNCDCAAIYSDLAEEA